MSLLTIPALPAEISKWVILILAIGLLGFLVKVVKRELWYLEIILKKY